MTAVPNAITARNGHPGDANSLEWLDNSVKALMHNVENKAPTSCFIGDVIQPGGGQVCKQNLPLARRLAANFLREITNGEVDRISRLVSECCKLCLV